MLDFSIGSDVQRDIFTAELVADDVIFAEIVLSQDKKRIIITFGNCFGKEFDFLELEEITRKAVKQLLYFEGVGNDFCEFMKK
jgi:hypothetical protein